MPILRSILASCAGVVLGASPAWALFFAQGLTGAKVGNLWAAGRSSHLDGYEVKGAFHIDPIPIYPVAFGGSLGWSTLQGDGQTSEAFGYDLTLEGVAWYSFGIGRYSLSPYGKLGYTVLGDYRIKRPQGRDNYDPTGLRLTAGLRWDLFYRIGLLCEIESATLLLTGGDQSVEAETVSVLMGVQGGL